MPFQVEDPTQDWRPNDGGGGSGGENQSPRHRPILARDFGPLLNRAAAFTASQPSVGQEAGPMIRVFFADVVRGVRSYEFSMQAIAANDRANGLARGSNYNRYY